MLRDRKGYEGLVEEGGYSKSICSGDENSGVPEWCPSRGLLANDVSSSKSEATFSIGLVRYLHCTTQFLFLSLQHSLSLSLQHTYFLSHAHTHTHTTSTMGPIGTEQKRTEWQTSEIKMCMGMPCLANT